MCDGRAATIPALRRSLTRPTVNAIWQASRDAERIGVVCPSCRHATREVDVPLPNGFQVLDVCRRCHVVWFDPGEYLTMPKSAPEAPPQRPRIDPRVAEAMGTFQLQHDKRMKAHRETMDPEPLAGPDAAWKWIAGILGMPVHMKDAAVDRRPVATWALLASIAAVSIPAFSNLKDIVASFGFLPAEPMRWAGLTFFTSFLLHGDWLHLVGNAYFLWLFGPGVEGVLGWRQFLVLVALATVVGDVAFLLSVEDPTIPAIGASGGISGVVAYYACRFPWVRLGFLFYLFWWIRIPAIAWFGFWILIQLVGTQHAASGIAYSAHLGGALVGVAFWAKSQWSGSFE